MLARLAADRCDVVDESLERAIEYYSARFDDRSRIEEMYHRLMLDQPAVLLEWLAALDAPRPARCHG
jgi:hypothetical protein